ncbi:Hypothetical Protein FCC1311_107952 [Hondaea fermentalgiana]|uniref:Uncharacterized protein n=1 Tax=Hondaea fermentalgiana TaxID=2315210 RepID=A0A2R5H2F3_9STRA|nr:Hypothetical Protein FCC1311_107952 [Hondaea fermentalgiana]|eukprot:GBG34574.1 Hypothetical Protein FCC1311_107952 [Hondaea fermentalgiana]
MLATIDERPELASGWEERTNSPHYVEAPRTKHDSWSVTQAMQHESQKRPRHIAQHRQQEQHMRALYKNSSHSRTNRRFGADQATSISWTSSPPSAKQQLQQQLQASRNGGYSADYSVAKPSIEDSLLLQLAPEREAALRVRQTRRLSSGSRGHLVSQSEADLVDLETLQSSCWQRHQRKPRRKDHRKLLHKFARCLHL